MLIPNRYELREKLGVGGMGAVYTAKDRLTGEIIALKRLQTLDQDPVYGETSEGERLTAMATEFRTLAGLRHPHIVRVIDYGFTFEDGNAQPYFTMEYLPNAQTIADASVGQSRETQVRLLTEMLMALVYLHRRGIIHCDLKPDNILVTQSGNVKVLDFGLAINRVRQSDTGISDTISGTLAYMAPELFIGQTPSIQSDLFAVGVIAYRSFTGEPPFGGETVNLQLSQTFNSPPNSSIFDSELGDLISYLLAKTPSERPTDAESVIRMLCEATNQPIPTENQAIRESFLQASTFVGRDAEFSQLTDALEKVITDSTLVYLIGGESGVGKSRLLEELRARALVTGALVLRGQGVAESGLPYQLWRDAARELALTTALSDLEASVLKEIAPDIGLLLGREVANAPELTGTDARQRLVLTLIDMLKRQSQPVVLLLEDLQWATEGLELIRQILTMRDQLQRLLVLGTYRDDECPRLIDELPGAQPIKLRRLENDAIAELTLSMLGEGGVQPELLSLIMRETEGNAFFMVETMRALAEEAGALSEIRKAALPQQILAGGVQQIIQRRLSRIPEHFRSLLKRTAMAGRLIDLNLLGLLAAGANPNDFLMVGADAGIFEVVEGRWRFAHDKLREMVLHDLQDGERRDLHRAVALAIEHTYPDDDSYHQMLMDHWQSAGDTTKELYYLVLVVTQLVESARIMSGPFYSPNAV